MTVSLKAEEDIGASIGRRKPMWGGSHLRARRMASGETKCQYLYLGLLASKTVRKLISVVCYGSPHR